MSHLVPLLEFNPMGGWRVASLMTPSRDSDYSDRWRVALPHATVAPHNIVASSDLLATMAERVARVLAPPLDLVILEPPSELLLTGFTLSMLWHERTQTDPARRWLREVIVAEATERLRPPTMPVRRAVASRKRSS